MHKYLPDKIAYPFRIILYQFWLNLILVSAKPILLYNIFFPLLLELLSDFTGLELIIHINNFNLALIIIIYILSLSFIIYQALNKSILKLAT
jgi:hypothetical protein